MFNFTNLFKYGDFNWCLINYRLCPSNLGNQKEMTATQSWLFVVIRARGFWSPFGAEMEELEIAREILEPESPIRLQRK